MATALADAPSTLALECDWRFAELVLRTHLDADLRDRYRTHPADVLAEYGLELPAGAPLPSLDWPAGDELVITDVDRVALLSTCITTTAASA